jgi:hypothetical protein
LIVFRIKLNCFNELGLLYVSGMSNTAFGGAPYTGPNQNSWIRAYLLPKFEIVWTKSTNRIGHGSYLQTDGIGGIYQIETRNDGCLDDPSCFSYNNYAYSLNKWDINGNWLSAQHMTAHSVATMSIDSNGVLVMAGTFWNPFEDILNAGWNFHQLNDGYVKKSTIELNCTCNDLNTLVGQVGTMLRLQTDFTYN